MNLTNNPLKEDQLKAFKNLVNSSSQEQLIWMSGYLEGRLDAGGISPGNNDKNTHETIPQSNIKLTILYGTETGRSRELAQKLSDKAAFKGIAANVYNMYDYDAGNLGQEENVAIIVSTHGEGDPPDMAEDFYKFLTSDAASPLDNLNYSVLALGDKSYKNFCQSGEDIDYALRELGAVRINQLVKCDVDYERDSEIWMNNFLLNVQPSDQEESEDEEPVGKEKVEYSKSNPFMATIKEKVRINGKDSDKEVYHLVLSLYDSGLEYQPGDSVGIFTKNPDQLVELILQQAQFDPEKSITIDEKELSIRDALTHHLEITVLTFDLLSRYQALSQDSKLKDLLEDDGKLDDYLYGHDLLDLLQDFPCQLTENKLLEMLRPIPPRLYSIASSMDNVGEEVHATVSVVRYQRKDRLRKGACSSYLADDLDVGDLIPVYIDKNPGFKLPLNGDKMIMVGAGTGIAPYRAFMQQRESDGVKGNTWLFFGARHLQSDFLYQNEWKKYQDKEYLERMEVAFSRDQDKKVYVQHRLMENEEELFEWIDNGACFYICGDKKNMAEGVNEALLDIIQNQAGMNREQAKQYMKEMKREKRLQVDVY